MAIIGLKVVQTEDRHLITLEPVSESSVIVTCFELMGGRWVKLGNPERWAKSLVEEEFEVCFDD